MATDANGNGCEWQRMNGNGFRSGSLLIIYRKIQIYLIENNFAEKIK